MNLCLLLVLVCMLSLIAMSRVVLCIAVCLGKRKQSLRQVHAGDPHAVLCFQHVAVSVQLKSFLSQPQTLNARMQTKKKRFQSIEPSVRIGLVLERFL